MILAADPCKKSLDFLFFSGTVNSNEIRDRLSLGDSGKFRHDGASLKLIANPDAPYSASVTVFLHCGQLVSLDSSVTILLAETHQLGCNILRMPLLSPRGNNEVHLASVADFITYKVLRIGQAECADKPGLVDSLKKWILHRECCPPVHLTPDQVGVVQCYLPDLVEHEWNERGWRMNLGLL